MSHSNRPKVTIDATPFFFQNSGVGRVTRTLVEHLQKMETGCEISLYSRSAKKRPNVSFGKYPVHHLRLPEVSEPVIRKLGLIERSCGAILYHATVHFLPL